MRCTTRCLTLIWIGCTVLFAWIPAAWGIAYELHDVGLPPGQTSATVKGMSAGGFATVMWTSGGLYVWNGADYQQAAGAGNKAHDVSRGGTVVGYYNDSGGQRPIVWSSSGSTTIAMFRVQGEAQGVNDRECITGYTYNTGEFVTGNRAFFYNPTGVGPTSREFGVLDVNGDNNTDSAFSVGIAVNNHDVCVGYSAEGYLGQVFVWDETDGFRGIGPTTTADYRPWDISDTDLIVGEYGSGGFMMDLDGNFTPLPQEARGVNAAGMIVGTSDMFHYQGVTSNVNNLLTNPTGYTVKSMTAINNVGVVMGMAEKSDGKWTPVMLMPVVMGQSVKGGSCDDLDDWTTSTTGTVTKTTDPNDAMNSVIEMTTGSPVSIGQLVDTPNGDFVISFDYWFQTTTGTLDVRLGNMSLLTLDAPAGVAADWSMGGVLVDNVSLMNLVNAELTFILDDAGLPGDATVYVDNISLGLVHAIPEPATLALLVLGAAGLAMRRRRRRSSPSA